ncbi:MAG: hypothetical protein QXD94_01600 [Sulfolobales archaeon]
MSDVISYLSEDVTPEQTVDRIDALASDLVTTASVASILRDIGEDYEDLIPLLKYLTSELVMELHTTSYVEGIVDELRGFITNYLWEVGDEFKLSILINDIVSLGIMVKEGVSDIDFAKEVLNEFIDTFSIDLSKCEVLQKVMNSEDPSLILQIMLIGLVLSVGGLGYDGG